MSFYVPALLLYLVLYLCIGALVGWLIYVGGLAWFWFINEVAHKFGVHAEILYFVRNRKAIRAAIDTHKAEHKAKVHF